MTLPEPNGRGGYEAMANALRDAKLNPEEVDYINAHATSTPAGDEVEALAIQKIFPERKKLLVSSTKSMTGHLLGAAGAVEAIFSVLAIRDQTVPPTINLDALETDYGIDFVPHEARKAAVNVVLSNSFGFGGTNGALIFKKVKNL
jgi:3-oxoacyl-[acyl-carrier-protein] synthase II